MLAGGFAVLTAVLLAMPRQAPVPLAEPAKVDKADLKPGARRIAMADPPGISVGGANQSCIGCHQIFKSGPTPSNTFHTDVHLNHGMNNRCVNCHDADQRDRLTLRDGTTVPFAQTPTLCAQCHGTAFRDWERGTHGKTMGSWKTGTPEQVRLTCNQCHDPHSPRYEPYTPLPGPNTLRMGEQATHVELEGKRSPLQRWLSKNGESKHGAEEKATAAETHGGQP